SGRSVEHAIDVLFADRHRVRSVRLALLEEHVQVLEDIRSQRVREDAPIPKSAWPPFHASLEPSDQETTTKRFHDLLDQRPLVRIFIGQFAVVQDSLDLAEIVLGAEIWPDGVRGGLLPFVWRCPKSATNREPRIPRMNRDEDLLENARFLHFRVQVRVVKQTARKA